MNINHWFMGVVEDINDPLGQGRVRVRCFGYHTDNHADLPTQDLPWSQCLLPTDSSASAIAQLQTNTWVMGFFRDGEELQDSVIIGIFSGGLSSQSFDSNTNTGFGAISVENGSSSGSVPGVPPPSGPIDSNSFNVVGGPGSQVTNVTNGAVSNSAGGGYVPQTGFNDAAPPPTVSGGAADRIMQVAQSQVGVVETSVNQGPGIAKYWEACDYKTGYSARAPWCAAFVSWVIKEAGVVPESNRPTTASAYGYRDWARGKGKGVCQIRTNPRVIYAGDIVVCSFSHVGIAIGNSEGAFVKTIDGNCSGKVKVVNRKLSAITDAISIGQPGTGTPLPPIPNEPSIAQTPSLAPSPDQYAAQQAAAASATVPASAVRSEGLKTPNVPSSSSALDSLLLAAKSVKNATPSQSSQDTQCT